MLERRPTISTHVLDTGTGEPALGVAVRVMRLVSDGAEVPAGEGITDADGRIRELLDTELTPGDYRLTFDLAGRGGEFFVGVSVVVRVTNADRSHHVPLLLAPFGVTTYRGR